MKMTYEINNLSSMGFRFPSIVEFFNGVKYKVLATMPRSEHQLEKRDSSCYQYMQRRYRSKTTLHSQ